MWDPKITFSLWPSSTVRSTSNGLCWRSAKDFYNPFSEYHRKPTNPHTAAAWYGSEIIFAWLCFLLGMVIYIPVSLLLCQMPQRVLPTWSSHPSREALTLAKHSSFSPQEPEVSPRIWSLKEHNSSILYQHAYSQHTGTPDAGAALGSMNKVCRELSSQHRSPLQFRQLKRVRLAKTYFSLFNLTCFPA